MQINPFIDYFSFSNELALFYSLFSNCDQHIILSPLIHLQTLCNLACMPFSVICWSHIFHSHYMSFKYMLFSVHDILPHCMIFTYNLLWSKIYMNDIIYHSYIFYLHICFELNVNPHAYYLNLNYKKYIK